jgi:hypothetical protein
VTKTATARRRTVLITKPFREADIAHAPMNKTIADLHAERARLCVELNSLDEFLRMNKKPQWKLGGLPTEERRQFSAVLSRKNAAVSEIAKVNAAIVAAATQPVGDTEDRRGRLFAKGLRHAARIAEGCATVEDAVRAILADAEERDASEEPQ